MNVDSFEPARRIVVLGVGNILWADEGFGVRCVETLGDGWDFPPDVEILDGGTLGLALVPLLLDASHVLYKTFYIVDRPVGRVLGPPTIDAIVRGKNAQVLLLNHDLLGALAREGDGNYALPTEPTSYQQRQHAIRTWQIR